MRIQTAAEREWSAYANNSKLPEPEALPTLEVLQELESQAKALRDCAVYADWIADMQSDFGRADWMNRVVARGRERLREHAESERDPELVASLVEAK